MTNLIIACFMLGVATALFIATLMAVLFAKWVKRTVGEIIFSR